MNGINDSVERRSCLMKNVKGEGAFVTCVTSAKAEIDQSF